MRVWSLGYTIFNAGSAGTGVPPQLPQSAPQFPCVPSRKNVTVAVPLTQPSVAVTVTTPPAYGFGVRAPGAIVPGSVASSRVAVHVSVLESSGLLPSANVPEAVKVMGAAVLPSSVTLESAGVSVIDWRPETQAPAPPPAVPP